MRESKRTEGYHRAVGAVRAAVLARVLAIWNGLPAYRDADIDRFVDWVVPLVQAGQMQTAELTAAYFESGIVQREIILNGRGIPAKEVYRRPAISTYTALSEGATVSSAIKAGATRLTDLVLTDMQLAKTHQSQQSLQSKGVTQYRRVLTGSENCALCVLASTQRYWTGDLMPIHPKCDCTVDEIPPGWTGQVLDPDLRDLVYEQVKEAKDGFPEYSEFVSVRMHGEYGPTLAWKGQKFTSEADIRALN